jgi:inosine/xanthosine triphosphate pyrophosphatase family protein
MKKIVIATSNPHKFLEVKEILKDLPYQFVRKNIIRELLNKSKNSA